MRTSQELMEFLVLCEDDRKVDLTAGEVRLLLNSDFKSKQIGSLINSVIIVANRFINKVESGRAKSVETYADMQQLKLEAEALK